MNKKRLKILGKKISNFVFFQTIFQLILLFLSINIVICDEKSDSKAKSVLKLLIIIGGIIVLFLICLGIYLYCRKKRRQSQELFLEGVNILEKNNSEEINLREKIIKNGTKILSDYLKEKLICDIYNINFEIFGNQCSICLDNFIYNNSPIILSGCMHLFHQKCLGEYSEKIDLNKQIISQFICPSCRQNMLININKIKMCLERHPNFFEHMHNNKKITKLEHVKKLINHITKEIEKEKINKNKIKKKNKNDRIFKSPYDNDLKNSSESIDIKPDISSKDNGTNLENNEETSQNNNHNGNIVENKVSNPPEKSLIDICKK